MNENPPTRSVSEVIEDREFLGRLERIRKICAQREAEFQLWFGGQSTAPSPCPAHPEVLLPVSERATRESFSDNGWTLKRDACCLCREDAMLAKAGVPRAMLHCRLENFIPRDENEANHLQTVREFIRDRVCFLLMLGNLGTGKSHLAVAAMRAFKRPFFVMQSTLLRKLRDTYGNRNAVDPVELCQRADLFVLDEIGLTAGGKDELPMLHEILDHRYGEQSPTILTGNVNAPQMREVLGERIVDRLREGCYAALSFGGESHRADRQARYFETAIKALEEKETSPSSHAPRFTSPLI